MEDSKYKSKTMEMLENKSSSLTENKYVSFREDLNKELETIKNKDDGLKVNNKERYNEPEKKEEEKNIFFKFLDNFIPQKTTPSAISKEPNEARYDGLTTQDIIAPIDLEVDFNTLQMGNYYFRSFFISGYQDLLVLTGYPLLLTSNILFE